MIPGMLLVTCLSAGLIATAVAYAFERRSNRSREALLKRATHAARMVAWRFDPATKLIEIELADARFRSVLPAPRFSLRQALAHIHADDRRALWLRVQAALERGEPFVHRFRVLTDCASSPLWMESHGTLVCCARGAKRFVCGELVDITSHRLAAEALEANDRRKDQFLATLAHELRNPLAAVVMAARQLSRKDLDAAAERGWVESIERQAHLLTRLTEDLLDVGRIKQHRLVLARETVDLCQLVRQAVDDVRWMAGQRDHEIELRLPAGDACIDGDRARLLQVVTNLLTNAIKYTPRSGGIRLDVECQDRSAVVRVSDDGIGIPLEEQRGVFEPFYQVAGSSTRADGGLGVGLAVVRHIVDLHGGSVSLSSDGVNCGTQFILHFPLLITSTTQHVTPRAFGTCAANQELPSRPTRILLAEDNQDVAGPMAAALGQCGHTVRIASDGVEAIRIADEFRPELVVLDVQMPRANGDEVARTLRARQWASRTMLVGLSGWGARELGSRFDLSSFDSLLEKPARVETISSLIHLARGSSLDGARSPSRL